MKKKSLKPKVRFNNVRNISYQKGWDMQTDIHEQLKKNKLAWRGLSEAEKMSKYQINELLFCEHNHVFTIGKSGSIDHLLLDESGLKSKEVEFYKINRGGDITYHGPGQLTGYPIFDLDEFFTDVHKYVRYLEEVVIRLLDTYGIVGVREKGFTGVWIASNDREPQKRKICAIGVHLSRWVTMHGFALNINNDLAYYNHIIPCGIDDQSKTVTSIAYELDKKVDMNEVIMQMKSIFADVFEFEYI
ncbi:MAG: lipoyl(octanoyl) transferase LipB [Saprospiraceae bacterium]